MKMEENKMKKRAIAALMTLLLALALCACGGETTTDAGTEDQQEVSSGEVKQPEEAENTDSVTTENFQITINDAQLAKDYEGNDVVVIGVTWTNNHSESQMASVVLTAKAYQDGVEMDGAYTLQDDSIPIDDVYKNIKNGATQDVYYAFKLSGNTSDITMEVEEWLGGDEKAVKQFTFTDIQ